MNDRDLPPSSDPVGFDATITPGDERGSDAHAIPAPSSEALLPFAVRLASREAGVDRPAQLQEYDFGANRRPIERIVALKLDHFGDFVIALPALRLLRETFPRAHIRLICGAWNKASAERSGFVDEVRCFNYFPERPNQEVALDVEPLRAFEEAADGPFDLAIDLRVDEDTRHLLGRIDARLRCGIGSTFQFPLLDIALPHEHTARGDPGVAVEKYLYLPPDRFNSILEVKEPLQQFGSFVAGVLVHGPYTALPVGKLQAEVGLSVRGHVPGIRPASVRVEVVRDGGQLVVEKVFGRREILALRRGAVRLEFTNETRHSRYEFRVRVEGTPRPGTVRFSGVIVHQVEAAMVARFRPAELHVGEKLSLLVALVRERVADLYGVAAERATGAASASAQADRGPERIAVAPFSNSPIRNWPSEYYAQLIGMLLERRQCEVLLLGTKAQMDDAAAITGRISSPRLRNLVGRTSWSELQDVLRTADLVICNNSGIAHQAAALGARVLAVYSASHQPQEWGPRGIRARAIMYDVSCSPCGFELLRECVAGHACMREITPPRVLAEAEALLAGEGDLAEAEREPAALNTALGTTP
ncbi:MAG: hypothetical protein BGO51_02745 [Rhodospirillales bacterium 69-11]|nr:MAG: hypothetical protein BGO51_02745 [Rhodospirillales bacterium 69-11]